VFAELGINATVGDVLDVIPSKATEPTLVAQSLIGLCRRIEDGGGIGTGSVVLTNRNQRASECINSGELLIAIPDGFSAVRCQSLVERILKKQPKIRKLLKRTDPLAPRQSKPSNGGSSSSGGGGSFRSKASSRSTRTTGGMKRSSSMSSLTGLGLEAIEEGENESKSTISRDDGNDDSFGASNASDDNITARVSSTATDPNSNLNDIDIEEEIIRRKEEDDITRGEIQAMIRRESDKKLIEEKVQQSIEARNEIRAEIESRAQPIGAEEQQMDLNNEDHQAADHIERLARQASELESSFMSMPEPSISSEPPDSPPKKRRMHSRAAHRRKDENATLIAAFLPKSQQPADICNSGMLSVQEEAFPTYRDHFKTMKQKIKRAKASMKRKLKASTAASAAVVAFGSAFYHAWNPNPIGFSSYVLFIIVFVASAVVLRRRKLTIARRRRRSRSLSITPIRKGSIRRIQIAKASNET